MSSTKYSPAERQLREHSVDVIVTVNGGRDTAYSVLRGGGLVGMESAETRPPDNIPIEFVDWPFTKPEIPFDERWDQHFSIVQREEPRYAVAPDVDGRDLEDVLEYADLLGQYATHVIVVPKDVHPSEIPDRFRVGMPCQDRFGPTPWKWTDYQGCSSVHLLGGSPSKHHEIGKYYVPVRSVDTAAIVRAAGFGSIWSEDKWLDRDDGFYTAIECSVNNVASSWNGVKSHTYAKTQYEKAGDSYSDIGFPESDLIGPNDDIPFPGRAWIVEHK